MYCTTETHLKPNNFLFHFQVMKLDDVIVGKLSSEGPIRSQRPMPRSSIRRVGNTLDRNTGTYLGFKKGVKTIITAPLFLLNVRKNTYSRNMLGR